MASQYQLYLPSEKQLLKELKSELKQFIDHSSYQDIEGIPDFNQTGKKR